ncbi:MAG: leucine-rich repeat protein [Lachnospiraceae bacterium]|nr:leucine-rich repeat protein [Lachnospiraceae bacterium]
MNVKRVLAILLSITLAAGTPINVSASNEMVVVETEAEVLEEVVEAIETEIVTEEPQIDDYVTEGTESEETAVSANETEIVTEEILTEETVSENQAEMESKETPLSEVVIDDGTADENGFVISDGVLTGYTGAETDIVIPDTVVQINAKAFRDNKTLTSVTIPASVTKIGNEAFEGNTALTSVVWNEGLEQIGNNAFSNCESLINIRLENEEVVEGQVTIPSTLVEAGNRSFYNTKLRGMVFEEGTTCIPKSVADFSQISSVIIPDTVNTIASYAFRDSELEQVEIPASVTSIGSGAFASIDTLESVVWHEGLQTLGSSAFDGSDALKSISVGEETPIEGQVKIPASLISLGREGFDCKLLKKMVFTEGITTIPSYVAYISCIEEVIIPDTVTSIGNRAFSKSELKQIEIPASVTTIGEYAFDSITTLESVVWHEGIQTLKSYVFKGCNALKSISIGAETPVEGQVKIPASLTALNREVFDCALLKKMVFAEGITVVPEYVAYVSNIEEVVIPDTVTTIAINAFSESKLTTVVIPASVTKINNNAFMNITTLKSVLWNEGLQELGADVFQGCTSLENIRLPEEEALVGRLTIPASLTRCGMNAFLNTKLVQTAWAEGTTKILAYEVQGRTNVVEVIIPDTVTSIEARAFAGCSELAEITIPKGVTNLGEDTFKGCSSLQRAVIPKFVAKVFENKNIFSEVENLTIYGVEGSYIESYAARWEIPFERLISTCTLDKTEINLPVEETEKITILDLWQGEAPVFTSSDEAVAVVDENGVITAKAPGVATIQVNIDNSYFATATVQVYAPLKQLKLNVPKIELWKEETHQMQVIFVPENTTDEKKVTYTSSNPEVAVVSEDGCVTAIAEGTAQIMATAKASTWTKEAGFGEGQVQCVCEITVVPGEQIKKHEVAVPEPIFVLANLYGSLEEIDTDLLDGWKFAEPDADICADGDGVHSYPIRYEKEGYETLEAQLQITAARMIGMKATENVLTAIGQKGRDKVATQIFSVGADVSENAYQISYSSSDETVATVDKNGNITGIANGDCEITTSLSLVDMNGTVVEQDIFTAVTKVTVTDLFNIGAITLATEDEVFKDLLTNDNIMVGKEQLLNSEGKVDRTMTLAVSTTCLNGEAGSAKLAWTVTDTSVAKVSNITENSADLAIVGTGTTTITIEAQDAGKYTREIVLIVKDCEPKVQASYTLNRLAGKTALNITTVYNTTVKSVTLAGEDAGKFGIEADNGKFVLCLTDTGAGNKTYKKLKLQIVLNEITEVYEKDITVKVTAEKPKVTIKQNGNINLFYTDQEATFTVSGKYVDVAVITLKDEANTFFTLEYDKRTGKGKIIPKDTLTAAVASKMKKAQKTLPLEISFEGYPEETTVASPLVVKTVYKKPSLSIKEGTTVIYSLQSMSCGMTPYNKTDKQELKDYDITWNSLNSEQFELIKEKDSDAVVLQAKPGVEDGTYKMNFQISRNNWRESLGIKHTVKVTSILPDVKLSTSKITLNRKLALLEKADIAITVPGNVALSAVDFELTGDNINQIEYKWTGSGIQIGMKEPALDKGTYRFIGKAKFANGTYSKEKTIAITVKEDTPKVKLTQKGKLDAAIKNSAIEITPKFSNVNGKLTKATLYGKYAEAFEAIVTEKGTVLLSLKKGAGADKQVVPGQYYDLYMECELDNDVVFSYKEGTDNQAPSFKVRPIQSKAKVKADVNKLTMYQSVVAMQEKLAFTMTAPKGAKIGKIELTNYKDAFVYDDKAELLILLDGSELASGKTYTLNFNVYPESNTKNLTPTIVKVNVTIQK